MWVAGVDGYKRGWIVALRNIDSPSLRLTSINRIADIETLPEKPQCVAIDMPTGFLDVARKGGRECERMARKKLKGRTSSVFSAPARGTLQSDLYSDACQLNRNSGPDCIAISLQAFGLRCKMRELDRWITPDRQRRCIEAHPELAFALLNGGKPVLSPKRKHEGRSDRLRLLRRAGIDVSDTILNVRPNGCAIDDLLDAIVLTRTAERHLRGEAICLPPAPPRDARGLRMEIWY